MVARKITASTIESGRLSRTVVFAFVSNFARSLDLNDLRLIGDLVNLSVEAFIRFHLSFAPGGAISKFKCRCSYRTVRDVWYRYSKFVLLVRSIRAAVLAPLEDRGGRM